MKGKNSYDEIWGYTCQQIEEYLVKSGALKQEDIYCVKGCSIMLETLPDRVVGTLALPRTRVRMEGPSAEAFHHSFLLNFLSGGG